MMPQRLALAAAAVAATVVLAVGLVAAGFAPVPAGQPAAASLEQPASDQAATPSLEPEVVYVKPAPAPKTVVLEQRASRSGSSASRTSTVRSEERDHDAEERAERRQEEREAASERRKEAAERAEERHEREDDD
jgi:hypothetical protein